MTDVSETPKELRWVKERSACSLSNIFKALESGVRADTEDVQALQPEGLQLHFEFQSQSNKQFSVTRIDDPRVHVGESVVFSLGKDSIVVETRDNSSNNKMFSATITLDDDGNCKLRVQDKTLEQWQVRRMALERLFFGPYWFSSSAPA